MAQRFKLVLTLVVLLGLFWVTSFAQTVSISVTAVNNSVTVNAAAIMAGVLSSSRAFDVSVTASANFTVDVRLDEIRVNGLPSTIPASALSLTANASGALGTTNVPINPFPSFATNQSISNAFSGLAGASSETSEIDVDLHLQPLGNRTQNDNITYTLTFIVTEQ